MIWKLLGACLVVAAGGWGGLTVADELARRPRQLRALQAALQMLDTEIVYGATPLPEALAKVGRAAACGVGEVFSSAARLLESGRGYTPGEAWELALGRAGKETALSGEDRAVLAAFGKSLGCSDREGQHKNIALTLLHLRRLEEAAQAARARHERLWRLGGFLVGSALALLFL